MRVFLYSSSEKISNLILLKELLTGESQGQMMCLIYSSISMDPSEQRVRDPLVGHYLIYCFSTEPYSNRTDQSTVFQCWCPYCISWNQFSPASQAQFISSQLVICKVLRIEYLLQFYWSKIGSLTRDGAWSLT